MILLDGKKIAQKVLDNLAEEIKSRGLDLSLGIIFLGQNPVSQKYLEQKQKAGRAVGIDFKIYGFPENIGEAELKAEIGKMARGSAVSGIVIQLPLPKNMMTNKILNLIPAGKDIDCLGRINTGRFCQGDDLILPPVVGAVKKLFEKYKISVRGKNAVVIGSGRLVGLPLSIWLIKEGATVTVCNRLTKNLASFTKKADIVISGVGRPNLVRGSMIKKGAIVVDCGTSVENRPASAKASARQRKTVGDIEISSVSKKAGFLAPVPGGVGPLTIACLLENLLKLSK